MVISGAVKSISKMSHWVRDTARSHENSLQLLRVQKLLKGRKVKVLAPGGTLVYVFAGQTVWWWPPLNPNVHKQSPHRKQSFFFVPIS